MNNQKTLILPSTNAGIEKGAKLLLQGEIVAFPTETVYGLGACVFNQSAIQKIYIAKGRPTDNPLIIHCAERADVERVAVQIPALFDTLFQKFAPGPLTMILKKHDVVPDSVCAGLPTVAVRFPQHPVAQALIRRVGEPLVAPSANRSGYVSPTKANHVMDDLAGRISAVIDGGACAVGVESTVLNILLNPPVILRPGMIKKEDIEQVLGLPIAERLSTELVNIPQSPGTKYRHYQPEAKVILITKDSEAKQFSDNPKHQPLWQTSTEPLPGYQLLHEQNVYDLFREADKQHIKTIIVLCNAEPPYNSALMNRLQKAAEISFLPHDESIVRTS